METKSHITPIAREGPERDQKLNRDLEDLSRAFKDASFRARLFPHQTYDISPMVNGMSLRPGRWRGFAPVGTTSNGGVITGFSVTQSSIYWAYVSD